MFSYTYTDYTIFYDIIFCMWGNDFFERMGAVRRFIRENILITSVSITGPVYIYIQGKRLFTLFCIT